MSHHPDLAQKDLETGLDSPDSQENQESCHWDRGYHNDRCELVIKELLETGLSQQTLL